MYPNYYVTKANPNHINVGQPCRLILKRLQYYCKIFFTMNTLCGAIQYTYNRYKSSKEKHINYRQLRIFLYEEFSLAELISFHV